MKLIKKEHAGLEYYTDGKLCYMMVHHKYRSEDFVIYKGIKSSCYFEGNLNYDVNQTYLWCVINPHNCILEIENSYSIGGYIIRFRKHLNVFKVDFSKDVYKVEKR